ncbi:MAG: amino acid adenylation domain-containing protein, partial [bacterium]|nr:amino acid adenylation domain-containing protein [bacterium]
MKPLDKKNIADILPLTPIQNGMLFHTLKEPGSKVYFEQLSLEISGNLDRNHFRQAWNTVVRTNEILRTIFRWEKMDKPVQVVLKEHLLEPVYYDMSGRKTAEETLLETVKQKDKAAPFDLTHVPFRVTMCSLSEDSHLMIISNHHILYDGWSTGIILKEFFEAYNTAAEGKDPVIPTKTKFKEYIKWLRNRDIKKQETFWKEYLKGFETQTELSIKNRKKDAKNNPSKKSDCFLPAPLVNRLEDYAVKHKVTMASLFYSAWGLLLQKYNNCSDVIFGTTVAGRNANLKGIENIAGLFINTIPLRITEFNGKGSGKIKDTITIENLIAQIHRQLRERREFENTSLVNIKEYCNLDMKDELFDTLLVLENYPLDERLKQKEGALVIDSYSMTETTHYDLTLGITMFDGIRLEVNYNNEYFAKERIKTLILHFENILQDMTTYPGKKTRDVTIMREDEKNKILYQFNQTARHYPKYKTIHQQLEEQAIKNPDRIALISENGAIPGSGSINLTYAQLNRTSSYQARQLAKKGFQAGDIAGIMGERSPRLITLIMAILKAGGAYLPIDPAFPEERIRYMMEDSSAKILLSESGEGLSKADLTGKMTTCMEMPINLNTDAQQIPHTHSVHNVHQVHDPVSGIQQPESSIQHPESSIQYPATSLAYIIYTSGTTGKPRGVAVPHSAVVNRLHWIKAKYQITENDVIMLKAAVTFDVSVCEIFRVILPGASLYLLPQGEEKEPPAIIRAIQKHKISIVGFIPSMMTVFLEEVENSSAHNKCRTLRKVIVGAEAMPPELTEQFQRTIGNRLNVRMTNAYGPTEATVDVTSFDCTAAKDYQTVPIGKPIANTTLLIVDRNKKLQPVGIPGELCIAGESLAAGYLNRPELTAEKFEEAGWQDSLSFPNNQYPIPNNVFYFTGDLARWLPDGNIDFIGRIDHQVKVRGYRIELGEIQNS